MIEFLVSYWHGASLYFQLLRFFLVLIVGLMIVRTFVMPFIGKLYSKKTDDVKARRSIENIVGIISLFVVFTIALNAGNFGDLVTVLAAIAAALTVAIGFGMREQVSSLVAGVFLHTDNPFVKGDYIKVGDTEGMVKDIKIRTTTLNGKNHEKTVVPNSKLTTEVVRNFTKGNKTKSTIKLKTEVEKVEKLEKKILKQIKEHDRVYKKPEPAFKYLNLDDGKAEVEASYWVKAPSDVEEVKTQVLEHVKDLFIKEKKEEDPS